MLYIERWLNLSYSTSPDCFINNTSWNTVSGLSSWMSEIDKWTWYWKGWPLAWAGQPVDHKALLLIIAILIAMGLTLLGLTNQGLARLTSPEETLILMVIYVKSEMCWSKQMFPSWARGRETNCPRHFKWFKRKFWEINSDGRYATCTISSEKEKKDWIQKTGGRHSKWGSLICSSFAHPQKKEKRTLMN